MGVTHCDIDIFLLSRMTPLAQANEAGFARPNVLGRFFIAVGTLLDAFFCKVRLSLVTSLALFSVNDLQVILVTPDAELSVFGAGPHNVNIFGSSTDKSIF